VKISDLQQSIEAFKNQFGNVEIEFWLDIDGQPLEFQLNKIHDGYNQSDSGSGIQTVCEIRFSKLTRQST